MLTLKLSVSVMLLAFYCTFLWTVSAETITEIPGEDLGMECPINEEFDGIYVRAKIPNSIELLYRDTTTGKVTVNIAYKKRLTYDVKAGKLTITLSNLQPSDSGLYLCEYTSILKKGVTEENNISLFVMKEPESLKVMKANKKEPPTNATDPLVLVSALLAFAVLMMISLVVVLWIVPKVKRLCKEPENESSKGGIYEEMHSHQRQLSTY